MIFSLKKRGYNSDETTHLALKPQINVPSPTLDYKYGQLYHHRPAGRQQIILNPTKIIQTLSQMKLFKPLKNHRSGRTNRLLHTGIEDLVCKSAVTAMHKKSGLSLRSNNYHSQQQNEDVPENRCATGWEERAVRNRNRATFV